MEYADMQMQQIEQLEKWGFVIDPTIIPETQMSETETQFEVPETEMTETEITTIPETQMNVFEDQLVVPETQTPDVIDCGAEEVDSYDSGEIEGVEIFEAADLIHPDEKEQGK